VMGVQLPRGVPKLTRPQRSGDLSGLRWGRTGTLSQGLLCSKRDPKSFKKLR